MGDDRFLYCARKKSAINFTSLPTVRLSTHKQFSGKDERDDKKKNNIFSCGSSKFNDWFWVLGKNDVIAAFVFHLSSDGGAQGIPKRICITLSAEKRISYAVWLRWPRKHRIRSRHTLSNKRFVYEFHNARPHNAHRTTNNRTGWQILFSMPTAWTLDRISCWLLSVTGSARKQHKADYHKNHKVSWTRHDEKMCTSDK